MVNLGLLLEAKAMHTGRSARNHLLALVQTNGVSQRWGDELIDMVGMRDGRARGSAGSPWDGPAAGHRVGAAGLGQPLGGRGVSRPTFPSDPCSQGFMQATSRSPG